MGELGAGLNSSYPTTLDTDNTLEVAGSTIVRAALVNDENDAIIKIQTEMGINPQGSASSVKAFLQNEHNTDGTHKSWRRLYSNTLTVAAQTITISGLDGNTSEWYWVFVRIVGGAAANAYLRPNNDSGTNYGYQYISGLDTTASAYRSTAEAGLYFAPITSSYITMFKGLLYAKSGYVRTLNGETTVSVTGTTITQTLKIDSVWSNTADNITSLVAYANAASGFDIGTSVELWGMG